MVRALANVVIADATFTQPTTVAPVSVTGTTMPSFDPGSAGVVFDSGSSAVQSYEAAFDVWFDRAFDGHLANGSTRPPCSPAADQGVCAGADAGWQAGLQHRATTIRGCQPGADCDSLGQMVGFVEDNVIGPAWTVARCFGDAFTCGDNLQTLALPIIVTGAGLAITVAGGALAIGSPATGGLSGPLGALLVAQGVVITGAGIYSGVRIYGEGDGLRPLSPVWEKSSG